MDVDKRCRTVIRSCLSDESEVEIDKPMGSKRVALWCTYRVSAASSIVTCVMAREGGPVHTNGHIPHALLNASPPLSSLSSVVNGKGNTPESVLFLVAGAFSTCVVDKPAKEQVTGNGPGHGKLDHVLVPFGMVGGYKSLDNHSALQCFHSFSPTPLHTRLTSCASLLL